ncbi:hypothetical protein MAUB1S_09674 [Mycolicibacterium aubagnense]
MACPNGYEFAPEGRAALISILEELGFDGIPGAEIDGVDWRDRLSDDQLRTLIPLMDLHLPDVRTIATLLANPQTIVSQELSRHGHA